MSRIKKNLQNSKDIKEKLILDEDIDFFEHGLKCGLEIHQQLKTKKLFCDCEFVDHVNNNDLAPDFSIVRRLRKSKSEIGDVDAAAKFEIKKKKLNTYLGFNDSCCLVELDEEPPHELNNNALNITLEVAKFFNMDFVDKIAFMRKIVLDGSNTTGFQRTALIATGGCIEEKNVGIETLCLEEDACKKIEDKNENGKHVSVYDLSRLGTPLIEIATAPDIKTPNQAKEVAEFIGMVLRSTNKVRRGVGTIRQDVNVSIKDGVRVEIKGAQKLDLIPDLVRFEVLRQLNLKTIFSVLNKKQIIVSEDYDLTSSLKNTKSKVLRKFIDNEGVILGVKVSNIAGFLGLKVQPKKTFGSQIAGRLKVLGIKGLFHSDELPNYGITDNEVREIKSELKCDENDAFILVAEKIDKARLAIKEINSFLKDLHLHKEVRKANLDGTTSYLRPMPGSSRMYPETDVPFVNISKNKIEKLPKIKLLSDQYVKLKEIYGLDVYYSKKLIKQGLDIVSLFKEFDKLDPKFIAEFLLDYPKEIKKRYDLDVDVMGHFKEILSKVNSGAINKKDAFEVLLLKAQNKEVDYSKFEKLPMNKIEEIVKKVVSNNKDAPKNALMGLVMKELKGKAEGKLVKKCLEEVLN